MHEFQQMLNLVALGAAGHELKIKETDIEWEKVVKCAKRHKVDNYIGIAIKLNRSISCPEPLRSQLIKEARSLTVSNALHRNAIMKLIEKMEAADIHGVLLKGYAISDCYKVPETRTCGDVDLLINKKEEKRAIRFMKSNGFSVLPRGKSSHHAICHHPQIGCVELHVILYDEFVEEIWFGKMDGAEFVEEPYTVKETNEGHYTTLGITDHLIFLILHMIKHFILSGMTVQMLTDIALYFTKHKEQINIKRVREILEKLKYEKLFNSLMWIMIKYAGFKQEDFLGICDQELKYAEKIITDFEKGGWMGYEDKAARNQGWHAYNRNLILKKENKTQYIIRMIKWNLAGISTALFPPIDRMKEKYPYAKRHPVLLPLAWFDRLIFRGIKAVKTGALTRAIVTDEKQLSHAANERVQLFKDLDMM